MNILIVEDDAFKARQLEETVISQLPHSLIRSVSSLQEAVGELDSYSFDAVLLDMAIPSHSGEGGSTDVYSQPIGGLDVLLYLFYDQRPEKVMILTQYPTIEYNREHVPLQKFKARLELDSITNLSAISFFGEDGVWKDRLAIFLEGVL